MLRFVVKDFKEIQSIDIELYKAADCYEIADLPELCLANIKKNVDMRNVLEVVAFADLFDLTDLYKKCCKIIQS